MSIPTTLLSAVTSTGSGESKTVKDITPDSLVHRGIVSNFSVVVVYATAAPTVATVKLEGSLDNINWVELGNTIDVSNIVVGFSIVNKPFLYIRGNLSAYTAGSCTGVTVTCVGVI